MQPVKLLYWTTALMITGILCLTTPARAGNGVPVLHLVPDTTITCTDPLNPDTDGDGCTDGMEVKVMDTDPRKVDTDGDGLGDCEEVNKYKTDPTKKDTDGDGCSDYDEIFKMKTNPRNPDTDGDGVTDCQDACPLVKGVKENKGCPAAGAPPAPPPAGTPTAPIPKGKNRLNMRHTYFKYNTFDFNYTRKDPKSGLGPKDDLDSLESYLKQCDEVRVWIIGHTSAEGSVKRNELLSNGRAKAVKEEMIKRGIDPKKILGYRGVGPADPEVQEPDPNTKLSKKLSREKNKTAAGKQLEALREQNRRITVEVMQPCSDEK